MAPGWTAVLPVKRLGVAKSRLRGAVPAHRHAELALAMVRDTAAAVLAAAAVAELLVISDDPTVAAVIRADRVRVVPDRPAGDLNAALRFGADEVAGLGRHRAALTGDLPALRPGELDAALAAATGRSFVADAAGGGTVLLAAAAGEALRPHFGLGSAAAHAASGARELTGDWPGLRRDVDTPADLGAVRELTLGPHTLALLRDLGLMTCRAPAA